MCTGQARFCSLLHVLIFIHVNEFKHYTSIGISFAVLACPVFLNCLLLFQVL
uniref:Uncharacterized protein n=1 Tax=Arundo donax TaxID=35708 RepID=A0A0A9GR29_ARUDO